MRIVHLILRLVFVLGLGWSRANGAPSYERVGIVSAFADEMRAAQAAINSTSQPARNTELNGTRFSEIDRDGRRLVFFLCGVSMVNAALTTQMAIDHFHLDALLFSGIAGGIDPSLWPGDVVVPDRWIHQGEAAWFNRDTRRPGGYVLPEGYRPKYGHFGQIFPTDVSVVRRGQPEPREVHAFSVDANLLKVARRISRTVSLSPSSGGSCRLAVGGAAMSGPVFLDNREFRDYAFRTWRTRVHEMEGTAVAQVAYVNSLPVIIVRGVSDYAGGQVGKNQEEEFTQIAAQNAAKVTAAILQGIGGPGSTNTKSMKPRFRTSIAKSELSE